MENIYKSGIDSIQLCTHVVLHIFNKILRALNKAALNRCKLRIFKRLWNFVESASTQSVGKFSIFAWYRERVPRRRISWQINHKQDNIQDVYKTLFIYILWWRNLFYTYLCVLCERINERTNKCSNERTICVNVNFQIHIVLQHCVSSRNEIRFNLSCTLITFFEFCRFDLWPLFGNLLYKFVIIWRTWLWFQWTNISIYLPCMNRFFFSSFRLLLAAFVSCEFHGISLLKLNFNNSHFCWSFYVSCSGWKFSRTYHKRTTTTETEMALNVDVPTASELFQDDDMVFPILMGRENLKILASPGSESSGVSSLDAEEAKVNISLK